MWQLTVLSLSFLFFFCFLCAADPYFSCSFLYSVLNHLDVYNIAELMLCWCFLTICISGFSFVNTFHQFVISTAQASSNCFRPLPSCFLGTYKWFTSAFRWSCPWMASNFLVFLSVFCTSSWCQLIIPKLYLSIGTANDPAVFFALNSVWY